METVCDSCKFCCLHSFGAGLDNLVLSCVLCFSDFGASWLKTCKSLRISCNPIVEASFLANDVTWYFWWRFFLGVGDHPQQNVGITPFWFWCVQKKHSFSLGGGDAECRHSTMTVLSAVSFDFRVNLLVLHCGGKRSLWWFALRWSCFVKGSNGPKSRRNKTESKEKQHNLHTLLRQLVPQMGCFYGVYTLMIEIHPLWWGKNHFCISSRYSMSSKCICVHGAF